MAPRPPQWSVTATVPLALFCPVPRFLPFGSPARGFFLPSGHTIPPLGWRMAAPKKQPDGEWQHQKTAGIADGSLDLLAITKKPGTTTAQRPLGLRASMAAPKKQCGWRMGSTKKAAWMADGQGGKPQWSPPVPELSIACCSAIPHVGLLVAGRFAAFALATDCPRKPTGTGKKAGEKTLQSATQICRKTTRNKATKQPAIGDPAIGTRGRTKHLRARCPIYIAREWKKGRKGQ